MAMISTVELDRFFTKCRWLAGSTKPWPARYVVAEQSTPSYHTISPEVTVTKVAPAWVCQPLCPPGATVSRSTPMSEAAFVLRKRSQWPALSALTSSGPKSPLDNGVGVKPDPGVASAGRTIDADAAMATTAATQVTATFRRRDVFLR